MIDEPTAKAIADAYRKGEKIKDIEKRFNLSRSTVYWALEKSGVAPSRAKTRQRLRGTDADLAALYSLIEAQDERIQELLQLLADNGITEPDPDE